MKPLYTSLYALLGIFCLTSALLSQNTGVCPELGAFSKALTKHQQVQIKQMLKTSGLMDAAGLSKEDQENLVIQYHEQRHSMGSTRGIVFDGDLNIEISKPLLKIGPGQVKDLETAFTPELIENWGIKNAAELSHEFGHLVKNDALCSTSEGSDLVEFWQPYPLNTNGGYLAKPYPLFFHPSFIAFAQDLVRAPSDIKQDKKHLIVGKPLPCLQDTLLQRSSEHPHRLNLLHTAAKHYAELYKTTQLMEDFWKKSKTMQHATHPDACLKEVTHNLWKIVQQATWVAQFNELQADKHAIESILRLPHNPPIKEQMLRARFNALYADLKRRGDIPTDKVFSHAPESIRLDMLLVGNQMLKEGQTPELTQKLNALAIPSYLQIPQEPKRSPRADITK